MSEETEGENIDLTDFSQNAADSAPSPDPAEAGNGAAAQAGGSGTDAAAPAASGGGAEVVEQDVQRSASDLEAVFEIPVNIAAVLGGTNMEVSDLLKLNEGDVVELDRKVGEAIDIFVNNRLVARGEVVLVEERLGVTMTEIIKSEKN